MPKKLKRYDGLGGWPGSRVAKVSRFENWGFSRGPAISEEQPDLQDGFDFCVEGDVRLGELVDREGLFARRWIQSEVEEAADVVVLVESAEQALGGLSFQAKLIQRDGTAEAACQGAIAIDDFA
jgi:hypothetical protein